MITLYKGITAGSEGGSEILNCVELLAHNKSLGTGIVVLRKTWVIIFVKSSTLSTQVKTKTTKTRTTKHHRQLQQTTAQQKQ